MNKSLLSALNDPERRLVAETERAALDGLDEDEVVSLHARIRRARDKYTGQYRRGASARVAEHGGRGMARPQNQRAALKAEAFEEALSRVSRRLAVLAHQAAVEVRTERLEAARAAKQAAAAIEPDGRADTVPSGTNRRSVTERPRGDRATRAPRSKKIAASTSAEGARRQAKRDSR